MHSFTSPKLSRWTQRTSRDPPERGEPLHNQKGEIIKAIEHDLNEEKERQKFQYRGFKRGYNPPCQGFICLQLNCSVVSGKNP